MNKASLDRGFGRCIVLRKAGATLKKYGNRAYDVITAPDNLQNVRSQMFKALGTDGIAEVGAPVDANSVRTCPSA